MQHRPTEAKIREISSLLSPSLTAAIELVFITPPMPLPVVVTKDLEAALVFLLPFSAARWNGGPKTKDMKLVDLRLVRAHALD